MKTAGDGKYRCFCGALSRFQCDWKTGKDTTCDRHLCPTHAKEVGTDKHLCPDHVKTYDQWKTNKETAA